MQLPTFSRAAFGTLTLAAAALCAPAHAALDIGDPAPRFTATAALGGKTFRYSLADALAKGPVVLYFFPAADSNECSIEAHAFAEALDQFAALGATVIGVSANMAIMGRSVSSTMGPSVSCAMRGSSFATTSRRNGSIARRTWPRASRYLNDSSCRLRPMSLFSRVWSAAPAVSAF